MSGPKNHHSFLPIVLAISLGLLVGACQPGGEGPETSTDAVLMPVADDPTVSFALWFEVGSQNDPPGKEGLAFLTGRLLAEGSTTVNSYEQILEKLYPLASSYEIRVDKEMTTLTGRTHGDNLETFFGLLSDAYLRPAFNEDDFERLRADQLNYLERTLRYASDEELGKAALDELVFAGSSYSHPPAGTVAGVNALTLDDVRGFYDTYYTRDNAVPALGGGFPPDLVDRFASSIDLLPEGDPTALLPPEVKPIAGLQVLLVSKPNADASISFGFPIDLQRGERDFYALWIANSWLGEHRSSVSHLYQVIRESRGMNYGDYSYIEEFPEGGFRQMPPTNVGRRQQLFEVWIRTLPNEQAHFALRAAMRELAALVEEGMSEEEFELSRSFLSKYHLHFAKTTRERLGYALDDRFYGVDGDGHLARFGEMMNSLTREEVNAAIKKHLQTSNVAIAIVTGDAESLQKALVDDAPSPITYPTPKSEEILAEDEEIVVFPLTVAADAVRIVPVEEIFAE